MYQFTRTVEAKNAALVPAALQFAREITGYINERYRINLQYGIQLFAGAVVHWHLQANSLDELSTLNGKLMQDREYLAILNKGRDLWIEGSFKDSIVNLFG